LGAPEPRLWSAYRELTEKAVITDLTHAFRPGQPRFPGFGTERRETPYDLDRGDGFTVHRDTLVGQWGTHVDPPAHFVPGPARWTGSRSRRWSWTTWRRGSSATALSRPVRSSPCTPAGPGGDGHRVRRSGG
jgi:hypothetical protein